MNNNRTTSEQQVNTNNNIKNNKKYKEINKEKFFLIDNGQNSYDEVYEN